MPPMPPLPPAEGAHRRQASAEHQQAVPEAIVDIYKAVRAKVTSKMRITLVLDVVISNEDSGSGQEAPPQSTRKED